MRARETAAGAAALLRKSPSEAGSSPATSACLPLLSPPRRRELLASTAGAENAIGAGSVGVGDGGGAAVGGKASGADSG